MEESFNLHGAHVGNVVSEDAFKEIVTLRRKLHARPELAFKEMFTSTTGIQIGCVFTDYNPYGNCNAHKSVRS